MEKTDESLSYLSHLGVVRFKQNDVHEQALPTIESHTKAWHHHYHDLKEHKKINLLVIKTQAPSSSLLYLN